MKGRGEMHVEPLIRGCRCCGGSLYGLGVHWRCGNGT